METFNKDREGTGTKEWSEISMNCVMGCQNNCIYCYARYNAVHRWGYCKSEDAWKNEKINWIRAKKKQKKCSGVIMTPSTHDITPNNLDAFLMMAENLLKVGNELLIVSKPRMECIEKIKTRFKDYKDKIMFRFTIGSFLNDTLIFFEPNASSYQERVNCLLHAYEEGWKTSVSCEPLLIDNINDTVGLVDLIEKWVTDTIWIGKLNRPEIRITNNEILNNSISQKVIDFQKDDRNIIEIHNALKDNKKIRWKDSIKEVLKRNSIIQ